MFYSIFFLVLNMQINGQNSAQPCSLLQQAELESALGGKAGKFTDRAIDSDHFCTIKVGKLGVTIRTAKREAQSGPSKEEIGAETLRKQGWVVNIKKDKELTTSTAIPPSSNEKYGYYATASIFRNGSVVAIEAVAAKKEDMPSIEALVSLVQKASARLAN